ncbi:MAG: sulfide/dihydroorotate dehydrogenase-like FAD/NAD-binding protein [Syntrophomonadaceae bacterium]
MYEIKRKAVLGPAINLFDVVAPEIARKAQAGQFIILRQNEWGERIPLTIADYDRERGLITIIFQEVGRSTIDLGKMEAGDKILDFVGPLGRPSEIDKYGNVVCVGGGVGIAPLYPITRELFAAGNKIVSVIGARSREVLIWEDKMRSVSNEIHIATDDGSYGTKGFVTDILKEVLNGEKIDMVLAIGPLVMMQSVSELTRTHGIKTLVSLNPIMLDGTGMCGACRVQVNGEIKFACVDGPEFDGHEVDWENARSRALMFKEEERIALQSERKHSHGEEGGCECQREK